MWPPSSRALRWAALALLGLAGPLGAAAQVAPGEVFPALPAAAPATAGQVVLVDFWASWCAPCKASFPAYGRLDRDFRAAGLVIVAVGVDVDPVAYESFVKRWAPGFFVCRDADQSLVRRVRIPTMPSSYLIDRRGRVRFVHPGYRGAETDAALRREIETLLAEKAS